MINIIMKFQIFKNFSISNFLKSINKQQSYSSLSQFYMSKSKKPNKSLSSTKQVKEAAASNLADTDPDKAIFLNKGGEICLNIFAKPGSKDTGISDIQPDAINVRIAAPPVDGEANKELIKYVSKLLSLRQSDVSLDKGSKNRNKVLVLSNCKLGINELMEKLKAECD